MLPVTASQIYSILGSDASLVPLAIKDIANSAGLTAGSYITGDKVEGKDRFIDEFGTQAIWLFGIPAYKKILDLIIKASGFDPKIDVRNFKNKDVFEKAKKFAQTDVIRKSLEKAEKNQKLLKGITIGKFAVSTLATIFTYAALTKFRHKHTENEIKEAFIKKQMMEEQKKKFGFTSASVPFSSAFSQVHKSKQPTFTGGVQDFIFNPVKNLMIVDASITGERLSHSRNKQDTIGYIVKEGSFWAFMYLMVKPIRNWLEKSAETKHNKSINLDARVIECPELHNAFKDGSIKKAIKSFPIEGTDAEIYEYINTHPDDFIVKMAKKSEIIPTLKEKNVLKMDRKIDNRKFTDIDEVKGVGKKLGKLYKQYTSSGEELDLFLNSVKKLKRASVFKNMGICVGVLGVIAPAIMVALRFMDKDNKKFKVQEEIEKKLKIAAGQSGS